MPCWIMGSVGSLLNGHSLNSKHCQASECTLKKGTGNQRQRRPGGRSLDALLKHGLAQGSSMTSSSQPSKALSHSRSGHSDDFFYIKVTQKPRSAYQRGGSLEDRLDGGVGTGSSDNMPDPGGSRLPPPPPKLPPPPPMAGRTAVERADKSAIFRPTAFKPVLPRSTSSPAAGAGAGARVPPADTRGHSTKQDTFSGTLSDSGRNSMSSLPTLSTSGSLSASMPGPAPATHSVGSSTTPAAAPPGGLLLLLPNCPPWTNNGGHGFKAAVSPSYANGRHRRGSPSTSADDDGPPPSRGPPSESGAGGIRSPVTTDELLIERLEQRLLERESELQELQDSFEDKEADTCLVLEERQRGRLEEVEGLQQHCSSQLRQAAQRAARDQQALQLQVNQLQVDNERLQEDISRTTREKDLAEVRLRSYETLSTQLAPTLEETQWEVCQKAGEISLLKQQLRDCQVDVGNKLSEVVRLKASLRELRAQLDALERQNKDQVDRIHACSVDIEVCQNELQRKKNEAGLLREKVGELETHIQAMKRDLMAAATEQQQAPVSGRQQSQQQGNADSLLLQDQQDSSSLLLLRREVERLKGQLWEERQAQERLAGGFRQERQTWTREKERVVRYQKQLQVNYLHVHRKNRDLESILREVTAELESSRAAAGEEPDKELAYGGSGLQTYEDVIATEI